MVKARLELWKCSYNTGEEVEGSKVVYGSINQEEIDYSVNKVSVCNSFNKSHLPKNQLAYIIEIAGVVNKRGREHQKLLQELAKKRKLGGYSENLEMYNGLLEVQIDDKRVKEYRVHNVSIEGYIESLAGTIDSKAVFKGEKEYSLKVAVLLSTEKDSYRIRRIDEV